MSWLAPLFGQLYSVTPWFLLTLVGLVVWHRQKRGDFLRRRERIARRLLSD
jgi:hypothetical protein